MPSKSVNDNVINIQDHTKPTNNRQGYPKHSPVFDRSGLKPPPKGDHMDYSGTIEEEDSEANGTNRNSRAGGTQGTITERSHNDSRGDNTGRSHYKPDMTPSHQESSRTGNKNTSRSGQNNTESNGSHGEGSSSDHEDPPTSSNRLTHGADPSPMKLMVSKQRTFKLPSRNHTPDMGHESFSKMDLLSGDF